MSKRPNQNKVRLGKYATNIGLDNNPDLRSFSDGPRKKWNTALVSYGSNAFGQINNADIMCSTPQLTLLPEDETADVLPHITHIASGNTVTIGVVAKKKIYIWGNGVGSQYRIPTLLKLSEKFVVQQISCGESHAAIVASNGKVYTWGSGENGALGHGNKQNQSTPKLVNYLSNLRCVSVSCGQYHTAFVAGVEDEISYVCIPSVASVESSYIHEGDSDERISQNTLICASLYTCGHGKAGQLGNGQSVAMTRTPQLVQWFVENGQKVAQASCGMHHTAVLCVPIHAVRVFTTNIFTFGWGEHGRLGLGNEEGSLEPMMVQFPEPFHAIHICAGEQHTIATSGRIGGCYAWGNNEFGQCGTGTQTSNNMCLVPTKVALPEGVRAIKVFCGGRHSSILSHDNQVYMWGWGEEGQLGNGTEKDSNLPKPCRLPSIMNVESSSIQCIDISLGMCHSVLLVQNREYRATTPPQEISAPLVVSENTSSPVILEESVIEPPPPPIEIPPIEEIPQEPLVIERIPITPLEVVKKEGVLETQEVIELPPVITPIQSLKDILYAREERREKNSTSEYLSMMDRYTAPPPSLVTQPTSVMMSAIEIVEEIVTENISNDHEEGVSMIDNTTSMNDEQPQLSKRRGSGSNNMQQYFYREGQDLESCYVANTAKRAEIRKMRKASQESETRHDIKKSSQKIK